MSIGRSVGAIVFDWDGTAVPDRSAPADDVRARVEALCKLGIHVAVVSGTHVGNIDGQLKARPSGPGRLLFALNRGSELFEVGTDGPHRLRRRKATTAENAALDTAADRVVADLAARGLEARIVSSRLNRRKIDLIPLPEWADPPKARLPELLDAVVARLRAAGIADLAEVVEMSQRASAECGLTDARITSDAKHVEIGLTDKSHSMLDLLDVLGEEGIGPGLLLVAGDEFGPVGGVPGSDSLLLKPLRGKASLHGRTLALSVGPEPNGVPDRVRHLGGGPATFLALLDEQLERARLGCVPDIDRDPAWVLRIASTDVLREPADEALLTLGAGGFATRGAVEEESVRSDPMVLAAGVYEGSGASQHLVTAPSWTSVGCTPPPRNDVRLLDLHTGVLLREEGLGFPHDSHPMRSARFASIALPGVMALRMEAGDGRLDPGPPLRSLTETNGDEFVVGGSHGGIAAAASQSVIRDGATDHLQRLAAYTRRSAGTARTEESRALLALAEERGYERLLSEHRALWARRWRDVSVSIPDDPLSEQGVRFALFQLWNNTHDHGELGVGARGLSGTGYSGHVFWDADVFILPAVLSMDPAIARAMLRYRLNRLGAARAHAARFGREGARFPWESARSGTDVTPTLGNLGGEEVQILTGEREEHVTADVAWSALRIPTWTGQPVPSATLTLLMETARYWASRCERDSDGTAHLRGVIGPDEYHELVDDNAYTNVMAKWNLRTAAELAERAGGASEETRSWWDLGAALVDGYEPSTGLYEQFRGYRALEPLLIADFAAPPIAADLLLGHERVARSQIIKQPDVLMLHHVVPEFLAPGSLLPNVEYYLPRTAHGSSLSPAVSASLLARIGEPDQAAALLRHALTLDLDDRNLTAATGLHMATFGGVWQCILNGFLGISIDRGTLRLAPCLPSAWHLLDVRFRCLSRRVHVRAQPDRLEIESDGPLRIGVGDEVRNLTGRLTFPWSAHRERAL